MQSLINSLGFCIRQRGFTSHLFHWPLRSRRFFRLQSLGSLGTLSHHFTQASSQSFSDGLKSKAFYIQLDLGCIRFFWFFSSKISISNLYSLTIILWSLRCKLTRTRCGQKQILATKHLWVVRIYETSVSSGIMAFTTDAMTLDDMIIVHNSNITQHKRNTKFATMNEVIKMVDEMISTQFDFD